MSIHSQNEDDDPTHFPSRKPARSNRSFGFSFSKASLEILNLLPVPLEKCLSIDNFLLLRVKLEDGLFNAYSVNVIRAVRT